MQRFCDEIEIETAHPAADDDDISEEIVEEKQKQEKSQEEWELCLDAECDQQTNK